MLKELFQCYKSIFSIVFCYLGLLSCFLFCGFVVGMHMINTLFGSIRKIDNKKWGKFILLFYAISIASFELISNSICKRNHRLNSIQLLSILDLISLTLLRAILIKCWAKDKVTYQFILESIKLLISANQKM